MEMGFDLGSKKKELYGWIFHNEFGKSRTEHSNSEICNKCTRARSRTDGCPGSKDAELSQVPGPDVACRLPFARASTCRRLPEAGETRDAKPKAPMPNSTLYLHRCHVRFPSPRPPMLAAVSSPAKGDATGSGLASFVHKLRAATGIATPVRTNIMMGE